MEWKVARLKHLNKTKISKVATCEGQKRSKYDYGQTFGGEEGYFWTIKATSRDQKHIRQNIITVSKILFRSCSIINIEYMA